MSKIKPPEDMTREDLITYVLRLKSMIANLQAANRKKNENSAGDPPTRTSTEEIK